MKWSRDADGQKAAGLMLEARTSYEHACGCKASDWREATDADFQRPVTDEEREWINIVRMVTFCEGWAARDQSACQVLAVLA